MNLRGLVLVGFSVACLGVASLGPALEKRRSMSLAIANTMEARSCMKTGIDTAFGRVGCFTPVIFSFGKSLF